MVAASSVRMSGTDGVGYELVCVWLELNFVLWWMFVFDNLIVWFLFSPVACDLILFVFHDAQRNSVCHWISIDVLLEYEEKRHKNFGMFQSTISFKWSNHTNNPNVWNFDGVVERQNSIHTHFKVLLREKDSTKRFGSSRTGSLVYEKLFFFSFVSNLFFCFFSKSIFLNCFHYFFIQEVLLSRKPPTTREIKIFCGSWNIGTFSHTHILSLSLSPSLFAFLCFSLFLSLLSIFNSKLSLQFLVVLELHCRWCSSSLQCAIGLLDTKRPIRHRCSCISGSKNSLQKIEFLSQTSRTKKSTLCTVVIFSLNNLNCFTGMWLYSKRWIYIVWRWLFCMDWSTFRRELYEIGRSLPLGHSNCCFCQTWFVLQNYSTQDFNSCYWFGQSDWQQRRSWSILFHFIHN